MEALLVLSLPIALAAGRLHLHLRAAERQLTQWRPAPAAPARRTPAAVQPLRPAAWAHSVA